MGISGMLVVCIIIGTFLPVKSTLEDQVVKLSEDFLQSVWRSSAEGGHDIPFDTMFSSWQTGTPEFHLLTELPPQMIIPQIQVVCNGTSLTLRVDKRFNGVLLNGNDLVLGEGCSSNGDSENHLVFNYQLSHCGTHRVTYNGLDVFSNWLHFKSRNPLFTWWLAPFTVPVSCTPQRSEVTPPIPVSASPKDWGFSMKAMHPSWTHAAETNIYQRGQVVHLQVTARPGPNQHLFIQSCFASALPDPEARPRHGVIVNKGCSASVASQFVAFRKEDSVNFILNTSHLPSKVYLHCSVIISDQGVTPDSKSCNYNKIKSRWEELSGDAQVCSCCGSRCKGSTFKNLPINATAVVSTGPLMIVYREPVVKPLLSVHGSDHSSSPPMANNVQSDSSDLGVSEYKTTSALKSGSTAPTGSRGWIASGSAITGNSIPEAPWLYPPVMADGLMVVGQDQGGTLTLWIPGQVQVSSDLGLEVALSASLRSDSPAESDASSSLQNDFQEKSQFPELHPIVAEQEKASSLNSPMTGAWSQGLKWPGSDYAVKGSDFVIDGWAIPQHQERAALLEESQRKLWGGKSRRPQTSAPSYRTGLQGYNKLPLGNMLNELDLHGDVLDHKLGELGLAQMHTIVHKPKVGTADGSQSVIRSKLQVTQAMDGSQTMSYEEELMRPRDGEGEIRTLGMQDGVQEIRRLGTGKRSLVSSLHDLLRRLDKAE